MSNANNIRVSSSQAAALHLAMDNPDTTVALSSTDALLRGDAPLAHERPHRDAEPDAGDGQRGDRHDPAGGGESVHRCTVARRRAAATPS